jgi:hypothetical protein
MNASGSSFGDVFYLLFVREFIVALCFQMKFYHGTKLTLTLIKTEHDKNVASMSTYVMSKYGIPVVFTIFFTTEEIASDVNIENLDNIVIVSRNCMEAYYGPLISKMACYASSIY